MRQFKKIYIEITNVCNLNCSFCPKTTRPSMFVQPEVFSHILQKVRCAGRFLNFHIMGEPLLHPDIGTLLDMAADAGMQVNITTNGTLLSSCADMLLSKPALRQINVSLHSVHGTATDSDAYLNGILAFADAARAAEKPYVCFRLWNEGSDNSQKSNSPLIQTIGNHFKCSTSLERLLDMQSNCTVAPGIFLNRASSFDWPCIQGNNIGESGFCQGLRDQIGIQVDGTVVPCCLDSEGTIALGNILKQTLEDIVESPRAKQMYDGFSQRRVVEPLCRRCGYRSRFDK